jgi:hypothetical protein
MTPLESGLRQAAVAAARKYSAGFYIQDGKLRCGTNDARILNDPDALTLTCWAADWFRLGFPTMTIGHKYAAALMTTTIPDIPIMAPWPAFLVRLPDRMMSLENGDRLEPLCHMVCIHAASMWFWFAFTEGKANLHRLNLSESEMRNFGFEIDGSNLTKYDERTMVALTRLLMNACVAMSDPRNVRPSAKGTAPPSIDPSGFPRYGGGTFQLGAPVTVDCRQPLQAFLRGVPHARSSLRWLVRGHWRNQACGPGLEQRAMKWIEPYWKGDRENALLIRDHKLSRTVTPNNVTADTD